MSIRVEKDGPVTIVYFDQGEAGDADGEARSGPSLVLQDEGRGHWAGHMLLPSWSLIKRPDNKVQVDVMHKEYPLVDGSPSPQHLPAFEWLTRNGVVMTRCRSGRALREVFIELSASRSRINVSGL